MKTAISLPDDIFAQASERARELGMSRSEFFALAARRYLDQLEISSTTRRIDEALARLETTDSSSTEAVAAGRYVLASIDDER